MSSVAGLVGFLSEPDDALRSFALNHINDNIDLVWPEVSGSIGQMYVCCMNVAGHRHAKSDLRVTSMRLAIPYHSMSDLLTYHTQ